MELGGGGGVQVSIIQWTCIEDAFGCGGGISLSVLQAVGKRLKQHDGNN